MSTPPDIDWNDLRAVQDEITRWAQETFPHRTDHHAAYKLNMEEIPELMMHKKEKGTEDIGPELADCLILLLDLASLWEVDVVEALRAKMAVNYGRSWNMDANGIMQHVPLVDDSEATVIITPVTTGLVTGMRCPGCNSTDSIVHAPVTSIYLYHCNLCGRDFDDDIPF